VDPNVSGIGTLYHEISRYHAILQRQHQIKLTKHNVQTQIWCENFAGRYCVKAFFHPICYEKFTIN
jgi:hypothetical protein